MRTATMDLGWRMCCLVVVMRHARFGSGMDAPAPLPASAYIELKNGARCAAFWQRSASVD